MLHQFLMVKPLGIAALDATNHSFKLSFLTAWVCKGCKWRNREYRVETLFECLYLQLNGLMEGV